ncbi:hypothetical protein HDU93_003462 [Gonapodya sp. JEL0774]|nr:hypothetical protein HDU93_003462 [Gonapodya sp. JEL0774]
MLLLRSITARASNAVSISATRCLSSSVPGLAAHAPGKLHDIPQPPLIDFPDVRFKNPAFIPDPDPDNIESHVGPLDIQPPVSDLQVPMNRSGLEGTWVPLELDVTKEDTPLGNYPRAPVEPHQFRNYFNPAYAFDRQDRRAFGQYVQDEDEILNIFAPNIRKDLTGQWLRLAGAVLGVAVFGYTWAATLNPEWRGNVNAAPPQYPFNGLIKELGGDEGATEMDRSLAAPHEGDQR